MRRRDALAGMAANLTILSPKIAFGYQTNSAMALGIIGTGNRGRYDGAFFGQDPRVRIAALCDLYPDQIDLAKTKIQAAAGAKSFKRSRTFSPSPASTPC